MKVFALFFFSLSLLCAKRSVKENQLMWGTDDVPTQEEFRAKADTYIKENFHSFEQASELYWQKVRSFLAPKVKDALEEMCAHAHLGGGEWAQKYCAYQCMSRVISDPTISPMLVESSTILEVVQGQETPMLPVALACPECGQWLFSWREGEGICFTGEVWSSTNTGLFPMALAFEGYRKGLILNTIPAPSEEGYHWSAHEGRFQHYTGGYKHDILHKREFLLRKHLLNTIYRTQEGYLLGDKLIEWSLEMIDQSEGDDRYDVLYFWFCFLHEQLVINIPLRMISSDDFYTSGIHIRLQEFFDQIHPVVGCTKEDFLRQMETVLKQVQTKLPFTLLASPFDVLKEQTCALSKEWLGEEKEMLDGHDMKVIYEKLSDMKAPASSRWQVFLDPSFAQDFPRIYGVLLPDDIEYTAICCPYHPQKEYDYIVFLSSVKKAKSYEGCSCNYQLARYLTARMVSRINPHMTENMLFAFSSAERKYMARPLT